MGTPVVNVISGKGMPCNVEELAHLFHKTSSISEIWCFGYQNGQRRYVIVDEDGLLYFFNLYLLGGKGV
jgi:hypothetical protein